MIGELVDIGRAYTTDDGVYLNVESVEDYGLLVNQRLSDMLEGGGDREVFGAENKRHPADFVLWKLAKPGEPSWPSPWGDGRPGWHSECVVMSLDILGEGFDLHCGGMDLKFPHHENERAQAVALGKRFANHWMHNGFVVDAEGEKMSKSLGNVSNLLDLDGALRPPRLPHAVAAVALPRPGVGRSGQHRRLGQRARRSRLVRVAHGRLLPRPTPTPTCWLGSASGWTTTSTRRVRWRCCSTPFAGPTPRSMPAIRSRRDLVAAVHEICTAFGLVLNAGGDVPAEDAAKAAALDAARARQGLRHRRLDSRRAAGRRLDRRDHEGRHDTSPLSLRSLRSARLTRGTTSTAPRACRRRC